MPNAVPFFAIDATYRAQQQVFSSYLDRLFDDCNFVNGPLVQELENRIASRTGATHAIAVANASDGLTIALQAAGVGPGDEVIVPPVTFVSSASSVIQVGAKPVFADIDCETYSLHPGSVIRAITDKTRALMVVDLFHQPARLPELKDLAYRKDLVVVEDSAEAIGMFCDGVHAGLLGRVGVLSFFPTKTLGAFGDAGIMLTHDESVASLCRELRNHGRPPADHARVMRIGHGSRMDSLQAAVLLSRLESLDTEIEQRAELAQRYTQHLSEIEEVRVPAVAPRFYPCKGVWYVYVIECDRREELAAHLAANGIETETYYPRPLHLQQAFAHLGYGPGDFPVAERICSRTLALPLYPQLSETDVDAVCAMIVAFYGGGR